MKKQRKPSSRTAKVGGLSRLGDSALPGSNSAEISPRNNAEGTQDEPQGVAPGVRTAQDTLLVQRRTAQLRAPAGPAKIGGVVAEILERGYRIADTAPPPDKQTERDQRRSEINAEHWLRGVAPQLVALAAIEGERAEFAAEVDAEMQRGRSVALLLGPTVPVAIVAAAMLLIAHRRLAASDGLGDQVRSAGSWYAAGELWRGTASEIAQRSGLLVIDRIDLVYSRDAPIAIERVITDRNLAGRLTVATSAGGVAELTRSSRASLVRLFSDSGVIYEVEK